MPLSPLEHLLHMLDEADYLAAHIPEVGREQFKRDETLKRAVSSFSLPPAIRH
jgi:hypothetical protein